ncbi:histidine phosphatase family protein [Pseudonocardia sp. NPDC046786]|uniref:histidine phosphatase family protein n=1 Tax=Pseudonocardia sp. NPDC046786 TaxID=3155471 RepID=UPI0033F5965A
MARAKATRPAWSPAGGTSRSAPRGRPRPRAAELLVGHGCTPTVVHTSVLSRAVDAARIVWDELARRDGARPAARTHWELNERHYGAHQGATRVDIVARYGVRRYRRIWRATT